MVERACKKYIINKRLNLIFGGSVTINFICIAVVFVYEKYSFRKKMCVS